MNSSAIGVFDSGVGGLTVVRALRRELPGETITYLGDMARLPYGSKSPDTVARYSLACQRFLLDRGVGLMLVACNTASATALSTLSESSPVPIIGAVQPGARAAVDATRNRHVGVIGTLATIRSGAYERAIAGLDPSVRVSCLATPLLVPLAEEGWTHGDVPRAVAERYLGELFGTDPAIDTLVLGCTHYPLLVNTLTEAARSLAGRPVTVVDSATAMALAAKAELPWEAAGGGTGRLRAFVTDESRLDTLGPRFLGEPLASFERVDL